MKRQGKEEIVGVGGECFLFAFALALSSSLHVVPFTPLLLLLSFIVLADVFDLSLKRLPADRKSVV